VGAALALAAAVALPAAAVNLHLPEGDAQAFPALTDATGRVLADGTFSQRVTGDELLLRGVYTFPDGRVIEEKATLRIKPQLSQQSWSWIEKKGEQILRSYQVDFATGEAHARRTDQDGEDKHWDEKLTLEPGKSFAGIGVVYAVKNLREELAVGASAELRAVSFISKPVTAIVKITRDQEESSLRMGGRTIKTDRYTLHAELGALKRVFVNPPDQHIWLTRSSPAAFLRFEGPMVEPKDSIIRIDTVVSGTAGHAQARSPARKERTSSVTRAGASTMVK